MLQVENVITSRKKNEIRRIYTAAFPKEEQMPFPLMEAMSLLWHTRFLAFYDGETLCGLLYLASMGRTTFIMFFAVDEALRSRGYGGQILAQVQEMYPKNKLVVSIEPCDAAAENYGQRVRRKAFYVRCGYEESGCFMKMGTKQEILIKNGTFSKGRFILFFAAYSNGTVVPRVWRVKER